MARKLRSHRRSSITEVSPAAGATTRSHGPITRSCNSVTRSGKVYTAATSSITRSRTIRGSGKFYSAATSGTGAGDNSSPAGTITMDVPTAAAPGPGVGDTPLAADAIATATQSADNPGSGAGDTSSPAGTTTHASFPCITTMTNSGGSFSIPGISTIAESGAVVSLGIPFPDNSLDTLTWLAALERYVREHLEEIDGENEEQRLQDEAPKRELVFYPPFDKTTLVPILETLARCYRPAFYTEAELKFLVLEARVIKGLHKYAEAFRQHFPDQQARAIQELDNFARIRKVVFLYDDIVRMMSRADRITNPNLNLQI